MEKKKNTKKVLILDYDGTLYNGSIWQDWGKYAKLYLVSNCPVSYIESNSKRHGFDISIFDGIYSNQFNAEDVTKFDVYKTIQEKENAMPENVFVVGDSVEKDMKPAKRLGFNTLLVKELKDLDNVKLFVQKPIVKICANRNVGDAKMCLDASADLLGLLVGQAHSSTDFISKETIHI